MSQEHDSARRDFQAWLEDQPGNFYAADPQLRRLCAHLMGEDAFGERADHLSHFGAVAAGLLDEAAQVGNRPWNLPRLDRWSSVGERVEDIEHHPSYDVCGQAIYEDGRVISVYDQPPANLYAQAVFYLSSHTGEAGHNCPVACTAGVVKTLQAVASEAVRARWLPGLLAATYASRLDGAQFLTEVQGGSDVGANAVEARPDGEALGTTRWRIHGEKWFCSNAAADLILMTARVRGGADGTRGLGLFLVPRVLEDGAVNHYRIRRLKDKIGTRSMASGEMDFDGAVAYAMGPVDQGFQQVMAHVINTSRLYNSVGCAGMARRAFLVASGYARHRRAFGRTIGAYPLVQEMIAGMRTTSAALLAGSLGLAALADQAEAGALDGNDGAFLRVATNLVKMRSCQHSHRVILTGIETLGGNGAIESFSVLPRLLRDNVVYENWEGTHNTLIAQTVRDLAKDTLRSGFFGGLDRWLTVSDAGLHGALAHGREAVDRAQTALSDALSAQDSGTAAWLFRPHAEALGDAVLAAAYARDVATEEEQARREVETLGVGYFCDRFLGSTGDMRKPGDEERLGLIASLRDW